MADRESVNKTTASSTLLSNNLLDVSKLVGLDDFELQLAKTISNEIEREREARRAANEPAAVGFTGRRVEKVDTLHWDELLEGPGVLERCAELSNIAPSEVIEFALKKCNPENRRALMWMKAFYEKLRRDITSDLVKVSYAARHATIFREAEARSRRARAAADIRHDKEGASRDLNRRILAVWASGKYGSRKDCADKEWKHLGFSGQEAARNALKASNDPSPWPAKKKRKHVSE